VLAVLVAAVALPARSDALTLNGTVSEVVDGDTIKVVSGGFETPVRLIGIDTPETRDPRKVVQCFGPAASARAKRLLPIGQKVRLVTDPTQETRDRYARLLAYVFTPGHSGDRGSVNFALIATGFAKVYVYGGVRFEYAVPFFRAEHRARKAKDGLWGPPCRGNTTKPDPSGARPRSPTGTSG
jgi:micrococcal nuclease